MSTTVDNHQRHDDDEQTVVLVGTGLPAADSPDAVRMPRIGLGTWPMVGQEAADSVATALYSGYRHLDTAEKYGNEDAVGAGLRASGVDRETVFVTSKMLNTAFGGIEQVRAGLEGTLERMGLDYLDLYLIHWPNPDRTADQGTFLQTAQALAELAQTDKLRAWGISNFTVEHLRQLTKAGLVPPIHQIQVDPRVQQRPIEEATRAAGSITAAYSPLGRGGELFELEEITAPAQRLGVTPAQVVLRWHLQSGRTAVPRSGNPERQRQNLDVFHFTLTDTERAAIDALDTGAGPRLHPEEYGH